jgi:hypothetical protein
MQKNSALPKQPHHKFKLHYNPFMHGSAMWNNIDMVQQGLNLLLLFIHNNTF